MPKKKTLLKKLFSKTFPKNFTVKDMDALLRQSNCCEEPAGRGSGIKYKHISRRRLIFDRPHPGNELYRYQIVKLREFLEEIGETEDIEND